MASPLNYAEKYEQALDQAYPNVLHFGKLYATPNNGRYQWLNSKSIKVPTIATTGRVDGDRDSIEFATRNWSNSWETYTLENHRMWSTLVHPMDIDQTNMVGSIVNITKTFNEEQKFPEMDCYCLSSIYKKWVAQSQTADTTVLSAENILATIDKMIEKFDEANVPKSGRLLYVTTPTHTILKNAQGLTRNITVDMGGASNINRNVSRLDELEIISVPTSVMKSEYEFTTGVQAAGGAKQINLMLIHPSAVITPVKYEFARLDEPSAMSQGKYVYFEESFEDVFVLKHKVAAINFNMEAGG